MKRVNRAGFKICPVCKIEHPANSDYYYITPSTKKPRAYCIKCHRSKVKSLRYGKTKEANCGNCNNIFSYPDNKSWKGKFCSLKCFHLFRKRDCYDYERLSIFGLFDLNEDNYQKDFDYERR